MKSNIETKKYTLAEALVGGALALVLLVVVGSVFVAIDTVVTAFCLRWMWLWFVANYFHVPALTWVEAAGLSLLPVFIQSSRIYKDHTVDTWETIKTSLASPLICLGFAYFFHLFA